MFGEVEENVDGPAMHPYYPQHVAIPNYVPNTTSLIVALGVFGAIIGSVVLAALVLTRQFNPKLQRGDQLVLSWFVLCAFLHCCFEGYFVVNHAAIAGSQGLFAQVWKEYALSDSRYLTSDPFMLCIETLTTLIWGPLSVLTAVSIARDSKLRHLAQVVVCIGHLYGVALYYGTCHFEEKYRGVSYSRPEFLYFWVYYVGFNAPWVVVPLFLAYQSATAIQRSFNAAEVRKAS
ncbi:Emopamil-binding protein [Bombardia bombarda]|uniref:Emopamil-binding protein n=1 Tax=Bombardia bombarda TaxID=252184 RepID=A0AA40CB05_9PEZI|nr:Emopamil-binding protein [Bombardia bombarda]